MRRGARFSSGLGGAVLLLLAAGGLIGCSQPADLAKTSTMPRVVAGVAKLDERIESVTKPLDRFDLTMLELSVIDYAANLGAKECAAADGVVEEIPKPFASYQDPPGGYAYGGEVPDRLYGVWSPELAARWGFKHPPFSETTQQLQKNEEPASDHDTAIIQKCYLEVSKSTGVGGRALYGEDGQTVIARAHQHPDAQSTREGKAVSQQWVACIGKHSLAPDPESSSFEIKGEDAMTQEQAIKAALIVVQCKHDLGLIQKLSDIDAAYEQAFIDKNEAALVAFRKNIDAMVVKAKTLIASYGG